MKLVHSFETFRKLLLHNVVRMHKTLLWLTCTYLPSSAQTNSTYLPSSAQSNSTIACLPDNNLLYTCTYTTNVHNKVQQVDKEAVLQDKMSKIDHVTRHKETNRGIQPKLGPGTKIFKTHSLTLLACVLQLASAWSGCDGWHIISKPWQWSRHLKHRTIWKN